MTPSSHHRVLVLGLGEIERELGASGVVRRPDGSFSMACPSGGTCTMLPVGQLDAARAMLERLRPDVIVLDARGGGLALCRALLEHLDADRAGFGPVAPGRLLAIVDRGGAGTEAAFSLGRLGASTLLVAPGVEELLGRIDALVTARRRGRVAVCLAGGGIEGLFYEIGVLRALDACIADRSIADVDLFCGISAGAIVAAFLANGVGPDELARALIGKSARFEPILQSELFDLDFPELRRRLVRLSVQLARGGVGPRGALSSLARAVPNAAFRGERLRAWLERQLAAPGMTDSFDALRRPLYIGCTDQDTSQAAVFSAETTPDVPVHLAARASAGLVPFYAPVRIGERYYVDGGYSRTTNMRVAVDEGASLVLLIDPLVPVRSEVPGYVFERGGIFAAAQGLKALVNGRFDKAVRAIRATFPDVAFHLFQPERDVMRVLSGSPMKYFFRREVEEIAYRSTLAKIAASFDEMERDFAAHGITLRLPRDATRKSRSSAAKSPAVVRAASVVEA